MKCNLQSKHIAVWLVLVAGLLLPAGPAQATVMDLDALAALNPYLIHQYTFEGASVAIRQEDKKAALDLAPVTYGTATAGDIQYQTGFDPTTTAVVTYRVGGDDFTTDGGHGAGLSTRPNDLAFAGSFPDAAIEMLVRPDQASLSGTSGVGFAAMTRGQPSVRGFFLYQGSASGIGIDSLSALSGDAFNTAHEQTIVPDINPGHWYYYGTTFELKAADGITPGNAKTRITSYRADLTLGETTLTALGSIVVDGIFNGGGDAPLGVGIGDNFNTSGNILNAFPGGIDSLAIYSFEDDDGAVFGMSDFQSHLDALWLNNQPVFVIPEPSTWVLLLGGLLALRRSHRKRVA